MLKKKIIEIAEKTGLGVSPVMRIAATRIIEEFAELKNSLSAIGKSLPDFCNIIHQRYANYAFVSLKSLIASMPQQDRLEIEMAIELNQKDKLNKKEQETERLAQIQL